MTSTNIRDTLSFLLGQNRGLCTSVNIRNMLQSSYTHNDSFMISADEKQYDWPDIDAVLPTR